MRRGCEAEDMRRGRETWGKEAKVSVCQVEEAWERVGVG